MGGRLDAPLRIVGALVLVVLGLVVTHAAALWLGASLGARVTRRRMVRNAMRAIREANTPTGSARIRDLFNPPPMPSGQDGAGGPPAGSGTPGDASTFDDGGPP